jgi:hypothetical protein
MGVSLRFFRRVGKGFFSIEYVRKRIVRQILLNVQSDFQKPVNNPCDNAYEFYVMSD